MLKSPIVSVVMAVYNGERFLEEAIESILNQTFIDFDFIIIDDGSTDNSYVVLLEYASNDSRINLMRNETNKGVYYSRNRAMEHARGKYIAHMDADDISLSERLAKQVQFLEENPNIGVLGGHVQVIDEFGEISSLVWLKPEEHCMIRWKMCFDSPMMQPTVMMKRDVIALVNGYRSEHFCSEDYELWQRLSRITRFANLPEVLLLYRWSDSYNSNLSSRYHLLQYKNSIRISKLLMSEILGEEVPVSLVKKLKTHFGKPIFEGLDEVGDTAKLLYRLCRAFDKDPGLSPTEKHMIHKDAAKQVFQLFHPPGLEDRSWKALGLAWHLEPLLVSRLFTRAIVRKFVFR